MTPGGMPVTEKRVTEFVANKNGKNVPFYRISFRVNEHGPFSVDVEQAGFNDAVAQKAIHDKVAQVQALLR